LDTAHEERAIYVVSGVVNIGNDRFPSGQLVVLRPNAITVRNAKAEATRLVLVGGETMDGPRHIWWKFVSWRLDPCTTIMSFCMDCGYRGQTLRRHISTQHALNSDEYLKRWRLQSDHPLTAPAYSERRSTLAKALGLGRKPKARATPEMSSPAAPTPVDVARDSQATSAPGRRSRSAAKSVEVRAEAKPVRKRRSRLRVA